MQLAFFFSSTQFFDRSNSPPDLLDWSKPPQASVGRSGYIICLDVFCQGMSPVRDPAGSRCAAVSHRQTCEDQ